MSRKRPSMKDALKSSMSSEKAALDARFEKAENVLALREVKKQGMVNPIQEPPLEQVIQPVQTEQQAPKSRVLRRTFSITEEDYNAIIELKRRCNFQGFEVPQSQVIRAGIHLLTQLADEELRDSLHVVEVLRPGRAAS